ncbi:MAG: hypothetical protein HQM09_15485 [Candidatus Riflebacteria bacterium]|nr:hypothetical protein [Candidatus Riflebacteria bacterium]
MPALTCIGDIHIEGGKIGSFTDFHGAADLSANVENTILLSPKGSKTEIDVIVQVILNLLASGDFSTLSSSALVERITQAIVGVDLTSLTVYETATSQTTGQIANGMFIWASPFIGGSYWNGQDLKLSIDVPKTSDPVVKVALFLGSSQKLVEFVAPPFEYTLKDISGVTTYTALITYGSGANCSVKKTIICQSIVSNVTTTLCDGSVATITPDSYTPMTASVPFKIATFVVTLASNIDSKPGSFSLRLNRLGNSTTLALDSEKLKLSQSGKTLTVSTIGTTKPNRDYCIEFFGELSIDGQLLKFSSPSYYLKTVKAPYVIVIAGQSQACGRALKSDLQIQYPEVYGHTFKTKVWVDNLAESGGMDSTSHFVTPNPYEGHWEELDLFSPVRQFLQCAVTTHGVEVFLAYLFEQQYPDEQLYIVKFAYGAIPLAHNTDRDMDWSPEQSASYKRMYWAFVNYVLPNAFSSSELESRDFVPIGFVWAQGESDGKITRPEWTHVEGNDHVYLDNLTELFTMMQNDIPEIQSFRKYILKCVSGFATDGSPNSEVSEISQGYPFVKEFVIPDQILFCSGQNNNAVLIDGDSLPILGATYNINPHFNSTALNEIAQKIMNNFDPDPEM